MTVPLSELRREPFLHFVQDEFVPAELCRAACAEWPDECWPHWLRYDGERGQKLATRDALRLTPACAEIIREMARLPLLSLTGIVGTFPDLTLYGAGMSQINAGGELPLHLDSDHNPVTGWERAASAMLYLSDCEGGWLHLWGRDIHEPEVELQIISSIAPRAGRLVLFECGPAAWHSVGPVTSGKRLSLSLFFWRLAGSEPHVRPRAEFRGTE